MATNKITKLITSYKPIINNRFMIHYSVMDNGVDPKSYMLMVVDLVEEGFTTKYFSKEEDVVRLLKLLKEV